MKSTKSSLSFSLPCLSPCSTGEQCTASLAVAVANVRVHSLPHSLCVPASDANAVEACQCFFRLQPSTSPSCSGLTSGYVRMCGSVTVWSHWCRLSHPVEHTLFRLALRRSRTSAPVLRASPVPRPSVGGNGAEPAAVRSHPPPRHHLVDVWGCGSDAVRHHQHEPAGATMRGSALLLC